MASILAGRALSHFRKGMFIWDGPIYSCDMPVPFGDGPIYLFAGSYRPAQGSHLIWGGRSPARKQRAHLRLGGPCLPLGKHVYLLGWPYLLLRWTDRPSDGLTCIREAPFYFWEGP
eukprot:1346983-Pyramimonas_sp.AAC.1